MIFNRPRRREKKRLTWYFNETVAPTTVTIYYANFTCAGDSLIGIKIPKGLMSMGYIRSSGSNFGVYERRRWKTEKYRTITFDEEPTGDLLAFLEANATPQ